MPKQHPRLLGVCQESADCIVCSLHGDRELYIFVDFVSAQIAVPQYLLLSSFSANVLLISQEHTFEPSIRSCNGPEQKDLLRSLVGVIAIDSVIAAKLIRDCELIDRCQIHNGPEEYYVYFLYSLSQDLKVFPNLREVIMLSATDDTYQALAADFGWFLGKTVASEERGELYWQRISYYKAGPPMKKIPKITMLRYEIATGQTRRMGMRYTALAHLG